jgi:hypothetical protein
MAGLISVADLDARQVEYVDNAQAQAAIEDASAVARACVEPIFDDVATPDTPAAVVALVVNMVRRVLTNPRGLAQESLGDYSYATGGAGVATLLPTAREKKLLRKAASAYAAANDLDVPTFGAGGVYQQADLPAPLDSTLADPQA